VFSLANAAIGLVDLNSDDLDSVSDYLTVLLSSASARPSRWRSWAD
jgi:hypothetical protein